jgi:tetratricopeptide (TPR) repeat protein
MADDIRRWSDELAREPGSLVFLQLSEALRRQGQIEIALKIALRGLERHPRSVDAHDLVARIAVDKRDFARAFEEWEAVLRLEPEHVGAMKGLGYLCFQHGRFDDAERYLGRAAAQSGGSDITAALDTVRRTSGETAAPDLEEPDGVAPPLPNDPHWLFADLLVDDGQTALLLDGNGYVLGGLYVDAEGNDLSQEIGAELSGISDEVRRSTRHLDVGDWRAITFETEVAVVGMTPGPDHTLLVVAASKVTPLGLLRRLLDRCMERSAQWLAYGRGE